VKTRPPFQFLGIGLAGGIPASFVWSFAEDHRLPGLQLVAFILGVISGCCLLVGIALAISSVCEKAFKRRDHSHLE
jgi:hypothetical protein